MSYSGSIKSYLASYKSKRLGIEENGIWKKNNLRYEHILPEALIKLNILETFRKEFWEYYESTKTGVIKLHQDFHHLNSSQAMSFNLFFPFMYKDKLFLQLLLDSLDIAFGEVTEVAFEKIEKIEQIDEGTNFDFFIKYKSNIKVFFELKFSENNFGIAKNDVSHIRKHNDIYINLFNDIISPEFTSCETFFENYQIIRNLIYIGKNNTNYCRFIFPKKNGNLKIKEDIILKCLTEKYRDNVKIIYLEQLVDDLLIKYHDKNLSKLITHFELFKEKYICEI